LWQSVFIEVQAAKIESIKYFNGSEAAIHYPFKFSKVLTPRAVPREFYLRMDKGADFNSILKFNFEGKEILDAFKKLGSNGKSLQLKIQIEDKADEIKISLISESDSIHLKHTIVKNYDNALDSIKEIYMQKSEQGIIKAKFMDAMRSIKSLQNFFDVSESIAVNSSYIKNYAFQLADHTTKLLLNYIKVGDKKNGSKRVVRHYVNKLLPYAGKDDKSSDVASNALALSNDKISDLVLKNILGADFNVTTQNNELLLFNLACYYSLHKEKSKLLITIKRVIQRGKKPSQFMTDSDFKNYWDDPDFLKILSAKSKSLKGEEKTQLHLAILANRKDTVEFLLKKGASANELGKNGRTPLHLAAEVGSKAIAKLLILKGAKVNATIKSGGRTGETPLHWAAYYGRTDIAKLLLSKGAMPNIKSYHAGTPLHESMRSSHSELMVKLLLKYGAKVYIQNSSKWTALHKAASRANKEVLALLIEHHSNVNAKNYNGITPLHRAAAAGRTNNVKFLIDHNAKINAKDVSNLTALHEAAGARVDPQTEYRKDYKGVVAELLRRNAKVNVKDDHGSSPLHLAIGVNRMAIVKLLVNHGANVNAKDEDNTTPLHLAVRGNRVAIVKLLVNHGADVNAQNRRHYSPYTIAVAKKNEEIINILKSKTNVVVDKANDDLNRAQAALEHEDINKAMQLVKKHLKSGNARAQFMYGQFLAMKFYVENYGKGMSREIRKKQEQANQDTFKWMTKSAKQGYAPAQFALGTIYMEEGKGVEVDYVVGLMWIILGASQDSDKDSLKHALDQAKRNYSLTPNDIENAQRMAEQWRKK